MEGNSVSGGDLIEPLLQALVAIEAMLCSHPAMSRVPWPRQPEEFEGFSSQGIFSLYRGVEQKVFTLKWGDGLSDTLVETC